MLTFTAYEIRRMAKQDDRREARKRAMRRAARKAQRSLLTVLK